MTVGSVLFMKGPAGEVLSPGGGSQDPSQRPAASLACLSSEPAALLEILGEPVLHRVVEMLRRADVHPIYVVVDQAYRDSSAIRCLRRERIEVLSGPSGNLQALVERAVRRCREHGIENVLLLEPSIYAEIDVDAMVRAHQQGQQPITLASDESGALPVAMVNSSEPELAATLTQRRMLFPQPTTRFQHLGYLNRLRTAEDLRQLAQDALQRRCRIRPNGEEVQPGVWVARSAYIHAAARIAGPAYVGPNSRLRSGVALAECSTVERDCVVERGTALQNSSVLAGTYVGVCLDVSSSVLNQNRLVDLRRNVALEIVDSLVGAATRPGRTLGPSLWASMTGRRSASLRGWRGRFGHLLPGGQEVPPTPARMAYAPVESWGTLKSLSRTDSSSI